MRGFKVFVDGQLALFNGKSSLSAAAKILNTDTINLQRAYFDATVDRDLPVKVEFLFDGHNVVIYRTGS